MAIDAVGYHAAERREDEDGNLSGETNESEHGRRAGQPVDQPGLGNGLHPGTDERNELAADEEAIVAPAERAQCRRKGHSAIVDDARYSARSATIGSTLVARLAGI